jgi:hypothetical protein
MSVRVSPEHHGLIRDIANALRTRPELADVLRDVLQTQYEERTTERDTDVLQTVFERLAIMDEFTRRTMAFVENLNERLKVVEQPSAAKADEHKVKRKSKVTPEIRQRIFDLHDSGMLQKDIASTLDISTGYVCTLLKKR